MASVLIVLVIVVVGFAGWVKQTDNSSIELPDINWQETEKEEDEIAEGWKKYTNTEEGFSLQVPAGASTSTEAGRVKVTFLGPNNEPQTEIVDGFTFYVRKLQISEEQNLREKAEEAREDRFEELEVLEQIEEISVEDKEGYKFVLESALGGSVDYLVLPTEESNEAFVISYSIKGEDDDREEYQGMVNRMLSTLSSVNVN